MPGKRGLHSSPRWYRSGNRFQTLGHVRQGFGHPARRHQLREGPHLRKAPRIYIASLDNSLIDRANRTVWECVMKKKE